MSYGQCLISTKVILEDQKRQLKETKIIMENQVDTSDHVNHPPHYTKHPSGVECIEITEHMNFNLGNAVKYIWRADSKNNQVEDLHKAIWYIQREIGRITGEKIKL